jgi:hypothetical protein
MANFDSVELRLWECLDPALELAVLANNPALRQRARRDDLIRLIPDDDADPCLNVGVAPIASALRPIVPRLGVPERKNDVEGRLLPLAPRKR